MVKERLFSILSHLAPSPKVSQIPNLNSYPDHEHWYKYSWEKRSPSGILPLGAVNCVCSRT
jgi:hypothetical protein